MTQLHSDTAASTQTDCESLRKADEQIERLVESQALDDTNLGVLAIKLANQSRGMLSHDVTRERSVLSRAGAAAILRRVQAALVELRSGCRSTQDLTTKHLNSTQVLNGNLTVLHCSTKDFTSTKYFTAKLMANIIPYLSPYAKVGDTLCSISQHSNGNISFSLEGAIRAIEPLNTHNRKLKSTKKKVKAQE